MKIMHLMVAATPLLALSSELHAVAEIPEYGTERFEVPLAPENTGLGYMEFFDWLAGASDTELKVMYSDLCGVRLAEHVPLTPQMREQVGLQVWRRM